MQGATDNALPHVKKVIDEERHNNAIRTALCIEDFIPVHILFSDQRNYDKRNVTDEIYPPRFECDRCDYATCDESSLDNHKQIHFINGCLQCYNCDYTCTKIDSLDEHMYTHTTAELAKYISKSPQQLSQKKQDLFECYRCGFKTNKKIPFKVHVEACINGQNDGQLKDIVVHSGKLPFRCDECDYETSLKSSINRHKRTHSNTKQTKKYRPFKCNKCNYKTHSAYCLNSHNRIHRLKLSGKYPFACDKCDYKTYYKHDLTRHQRTHSDEKEFQCNLCNYGSNSLKGLNTHMLKHSGECPIRCNNCDFKTFSKRSLMQHKKTHPEEI